MKKSITIALLVLGVNSICAQDFGELEKVNGPVKQVTIALGAKGGASLFYGEGPGTGMKTVLWYDSLGRLTERAKYVGDKIEDGFVRQYTINNVCMEYEYDYKGLIKGNFRKIQLDSLGRHISSRRYREGRFYEGDSIVYDAEGRKIEWYDTPTEKDSFTLNESYAYDSLGRLSKKSIYWPEKAFYFDSLNIPREYLNYGAKHICTMEYLPNGNYIEHHVVKDGKKWKVKYIVKKGRLVRKEDKDGSATYSDFDQYGNWRKMQGTSDSFYFSMSMTTKREIEYYK